MLSSINEKLNKIEKIQNQYSESIFRNKATDKDKGNFLNWLASTGIKTHEEIFSQYLELLNIANGINFNGLFLYSIKDEDDHNIYQSNRIYWEDDDQTDFIFLGDDSISWFCFNINNMKYYILDKPSGTIIEEFDSFFNMLDVVLESII